MPTHTPPCLCPPVQVADLTAPCQHMCARTPFDKNHALWSSWAIQGLDEKGQIKGSVSPRAYVIAEVIADMLRFGSRVILVSLIHMTREHCPDLPGYCSTEHEDHRLDTSLPVCPAFKEIGKRIGPFDLALIPIGAYAPRYQMSPMHNAPIDAVRMFRDVVSHRSRTIAHSRLEPGHAR